MKVLRKAASERPSAPPTTIGDHIRRWRSERKLLQRDVAKEIGVSAATIGNWEKNGTLPPIAFMPAIIALLGCDPEPESALLSDRMRAYRRRNGLSIKEAALRAGIDEGSWGRWEATRRAPWKRYRILLAEFLSAERGRGGPR